LFIVYTELQLTLCSAHKLITALRKTLQYCSDMPIDLWKLHGQFTSELWRCWFGYRTFRNIKY